MAADSDVIRPINIGRGRETSVLDLTRALNEVSGRRRLEEPEFAPERPGGGQGRLSRRAARQARAWMGA